MNRPFYKLPELGATISGTAKTVTIDDIIAALGARIPDSTTSQKQFKVGFVLLTRAGGTTSSAVDAIETLRKAGAGKFAELTGGKGSIADVPASLELFLDSPADGANIVGPDTTVSGLVINTTGATTSVTVNGIPATLTGGRFVVTTVPLTQGNNTIIVTATDTNGLTTTATRNITSASGYSLGSVPGLIVGIATPTDGATITGPDVSVSGIVINSSGAETGVMVNGIPATVNGNRFIANHIPLQPGSNSITVTATDANGLTTAATRTVTTQPGHYIRITSNIESGTAPMEISLRIEGSFSVTNPQISAAGNATVEWLPWASQTELGAKLTSEGTLVITVSAVGPDGQTYSDTVTITVMSRVQLETLLKRKW